MKEKRALNRLKSKICVICFPNYPSKETGKGLDKYSYELLKGLKKQGMHPLVIEQGVIKHSLEYTMRNICLPMKILGVKADLYHAVSEFAAKDMVLARRLPLITTLHDLLPFFFHSVSPIKYSYQKFCLILASKSTKIIAASKTTKSLITSKLKVRPGKIKVVYHGVDHQVFRPMPREEGEKKTILYLGSLNRLKGGPVLIKAFSLIKKKLKDVELRIGGKGKDSVLFHRMVRELGIKSRVRFLGFVKDEELSRHYRSSDVFVWPSYFGFSLSVLDAMACGTPVIVSNAFDAKEYVGDAGILFEPGNVRQLADSLLYLLENEDVRRTYSRKAVRRAGLFSWQKTVEETLNIYNELLNTS